MAAAKQVYRGYPALLRALGLQVVPRGSPDWTRIQMDAGEVRRLISEFEDGVMAGGFDGYFFNSSSAMSDVAKALELIGAQRTLAIFRRACSHFPQGMPPDDRFQRQDLLLTEVSPDSEAFALEDRDFFEYPEDLQALAARFA